MTMHTPACAPPALAPNALATIASVKARLGLTDHDDDAPVIRCINSASDWVQKITGRTFKAQNHVEFLPLAQGQSQVTLQHFPVIGHIESHTGPGRGLSVRRTKKSLEATAQVKDTTLVLRCVDGLGAERETFIPITPGLSLGLLADKVSQTPGWSAQAGAAGPAGLLIPGHIIDAQITGLRPFLPACTRRVDCAPPGPDTGIISLPSGVPTPGIIRLAYRAGFETIPTEVQALCIRMSVRAYQSL